MKRIRLGIIYFVLGLAVLGTALAGCGATSTGSSPSTSSGGGSAASIGTTTATVGGQSVTILTNSAGRALYYYMPDTATSSACTGGCASAWPPVLSSAGAPTSTASLPGKLGVINDANGMQVTYNGHPLYTFANDTAPGTVTGNNVSNFFVATTTLPTIGGSGGSSANPSPTTGSGYGSGY